MTQSSFVATIINHNRESAVVSLRLSLRQTHFSGTMHYWKFSDGLILTAVGWLLSIWSLLGAIGYVVTQISGTGETPDFVFIGLWVILIIGVALSYTGSQLLHRRLLLAFPIVTVTVISVLLFILLPTVICSYRTCIPAGSQP